MFRALDMSSLGWVANIRSITRLGSMPLRTAKRCSLSVLVGHTSDSLHRYARIGELRGDSNAVLGSSQTKGAVSRTKLEALCVSCS